MTLTHRCTYSDCTQITGHAESHNGPTVEKRRREEERPLMLSGPPDADSDVDAEQLTHSNDPACCGGSHYQPAPQPEREVATDREFHIAMNLLGRYVTEHRDADEGSVEFDIGTSISIIILALSGSRADLAAAEQRARDAEEARDLFKNEVGEWIKTGKAAERRITLLKTRLQDMAHALEKARSL